MECRDINFIVLSGILLTLFRDIAVECCDILHLSLRCSSQFMSRHYLALSQHSFYNFALSIIATLLQQSTLLALEQFARNIN